MKRLMVVFCVAFVAAPAMADWEPGDEYKMHYPQMPDPAGWDVNATFPVVLADDWQCSQTGLVEDIHFWGSWKDGVAGEITSFVLSIHDNIPDPDGEDPLFSMPGEVLWSWETGLLYTAVEIVPGGLEGWYDPSAGTFLVDNHATYYQYNIVDIPDPFVQVEGTIYWLKISAKVALETPPREWGWKSSLSDQFMDDAVWAEDPTYAWDDLFEPPAFEQSLDLAFVITGPAIPAVSQWGLVVMLLLVVAAGTIVIRRRRAAVA